MYNPLGIKTDYSLLKSLIKVEDLVLYAKNNNLSCIGIMDNNLNSSYHFYKKCIENNIKPIIGLDREVENNRLLFYPTNINGLVNLFKLNYDLDTKVLSINNLNNYKDDIILIIPYESIDIYEVVSNIFDKVFIGYKNDDEKKNALVVSEDIIYINDIYSLSKSSSKFINYLHMIDMGKKLGDIELINYDDNVISLDKEDNSYFTDLINIEFNTGNRYIPHFDDEIKDSYEYLKNLAYKGLSKRLDGKVPSNYKERLDYELDVINNMGFTDYFLIVLDYVRYAIKNNIFVGAGRGSAAGSLVAYSLGITWIDPIKYDLLFERFLNPERISMPDIDIDFEDERREEVVSYVKNRYGDKRVAKIIAYGTMTAKEVLRCVAKINNVDDGTLNSLLKYINSKESLKDNMKGEVVNILNRNSILKKVYDESFYLEGIKKHITIHAAGVVISSVDLLDLIPLTISGDEILTGFDKDELEELGILKMDFLSIKNLTIMSNVIKDIEKNTGKKININNIPLDDKRVFELFSKGDTVGVFQFEATGMKNFLKRLKIEKFDDLVMAIALYRPGPMGSIDDFLDRKHGRKKIEYIIPELESILSSTYGILIYQEQIMEILRKLASFSYAEADIIRRAISKKKLSVIEETKTKFIEASIKNGYKEEDALKVYDLIVKFADFGFNKSHSVAYAMIAYQMAYLKVYYKDYYYMNLLNINIGGESKTKEYIEEAKSMGISILKPDINLSGKTYISESDGIRLPLRVIKGVGILASDSIINKRSDKKFNDFFEFIAECYGFNVNKKILESLIMAGVFDSFGENRATLIKNINSAITYGELIKDLDSSLVSKPVMERVEEYTDIELMEKEKELFGYYVSTHPSSKYPKNFKLINMKGYFDKIVDPVILVENIKVIKTKNGKDMAFLTGSDETTSSDFICFDNILPYLNDIKVGDLVKIQGRVERRLDKYNIIINKISKI